MNEDITYIINEVSQLIDIYKIDYEIDMRDSLIDFKRKIIEKDAKLAFDDLLIFIKPSIDSETFNNFRSNINSLLLQTQNLDNFQTIFKFLENLKLKSIINKRNLNLLEKYKFDVNNLINLILSRYAVEYINFNKRLKDKNVDFINPFWIDRTQGRHLCLFFRNVPDIEEYSYNEIYSDVYAKDKSEIGYIYQNDYYVRRNELFFLARGPILKHDINTIYVIDNIGLSLSRLPSITYSRSRTTADLVPGLLDLGFRIYAQYMDNGSRHYRIFKSKIITCQPEWVNLNEYDEFLVYFSISLLVYLKLLSNNEPLYIRETYIYLDSDNPEANKHIGEILSELINEKNKLLSGGKSLDLLNTVINALNSEFLEEIRTSELMLNFGFYEDLYYFLYPEY
jgi:hypothetical protein